MVQADLYKCVRIFKGFKSYFNSFVGTRQLSVSPRHRNIICDPKTISERRMRRNSRVRDIERRNVCSLRKLVRGVPMLLRADGILLMLLSSGARHSCPFRLKGIVIERRYETAKGRTERAADIVTIIITASRKKGERKCAPRPRAILIQVSFKRCYHGPRPINTFLAVRERR